MTLPLEKRAGQQEIFEIMPLAMPENHAGFHAAWIGLPRFPAEPAVRRAWCALLQAMRTRAELALRSKLVWDVYLQMWQLERPAGPLLISKNGSRWKPSIGVGVWPDRAAPQPLSKEDILNTLPGQPLREAYFHTLHIGATEEAVRNEVVDHTAGTGALLLTLVGKTWGNQQVRAISSHLEAHIEADELRGYPLYFPLLDARSLRSMSPDALETCLPDVPFYLREDTVEGAAFLLSRIPLESLFPPTFLPRLR